MTRVRIDRLDVHVKGASPATARAVAGRLGDAIRRQMTNAAEPAASRTAKPTGAAGIADRAAAQVGARIGRAR